MTRLPIVKFKTMEKLLLNLGFKIVRSKGAHVFYRNPDGRTTTLPIIQAGIYHVPLFVKYSVK